MCQHCQGIRTKAQSSTWLNSSEIKTMGFQRRGVLATWEKNNSCRLQRRQVVMAGSRKGSEIVRRSNRRRHVCATGLWNFCRMTETENKDLLIQKKKKKKEEIKLHGENLRVSRHHQGHNKNQTKNQYIDNVSAICWSEGLMHGSVYDRKMRVQSLITPQKKKSNTKARLSNI